MQEARSDDAVSWLERLAAGSTRSSGAHSKATIGAASSTLSRIASVGATGSLSARRGVGGNLTR
jgi:hypothetical protein